MSRVARNPIELPSGVETTLSATEISVKGGKGNLKLAIHESVEISQEGNVLKFAPRNKSTEAGALAGTFRALVNNMVIGVSQGYEKKLELQGVGYRARVKDQTVNLTLGFSHPISYDLPEGITATSPSQTEIIISGCDKQLVGQVAAEIREFRPPEPYKGKGVRYANERVFRKDAKKK